MKLFSFYIKKSKNGSLEHVVALDDLGLSFKAFFFGVFWFLYQKMWKESIFIILINFLFFWLHQKNFFGDGNFLVCLEIIFALLVAYNAEYWHSIYLKRLNYKFAGFCFGKNKIEAELKFVSNFNQTNFSN